jgi:hypothetical protein
MNRMRAEAIILYTSSPPYYPYICANVSLSQQGKSMALHLTLISPISKLGEKTREIIIKT